MLLPYSIPDFDRTTRGHLHWLNVWPLPPHLVH
jgi:hypothetical protein